MVRLLVVDDIIPNSKIGYGYPRALTLYNSFVELGFSVTLIPLNRGKETGNGFNKEINKKIKIIDLDDRSGIFSFFSENINKYDGVFISRPKNLKFLIDFLATLKNKPKIIYDVEAFSALREISQLKVHGHRDEKHFQGLVDIETDLINRADLISCVSHYELNILKKKIKKDFYFLSHFHNNKITTNTFDEREGLLFVGGFYSLPCPNLDALQFFLSKIFPVIRKNIKVNFKIVGYRANELRQSLSDVNDDNIEIINNADSLYEFYNEARVSVIPTRIGAGISYKFTEALSYGIPSVSTKLIAKQVASKNGYSGYNDPIRFANRVLELYQNKKLWNETRAASLEIISDNYTKERLYGEILRLKNNLVKK